MNEPSAPDAPVAESPSKVRTLMRRVPWRLVLLLAIVGIVAWRFSHTIDEARFSPFTLEFQKRHTVAVFTNDTPLFRTAWHTTSNDVLDYVRDTGFVEPVAIDDPHWELVYRVKSNEEGGLNRSWRSLRPKLVNWSKGHPDLAKTLWPVGFNLIRIGGEPESYAGYEFLGGLGENCENYADLEEAMRLIEVVCHVDAFKYAPPRIQSAAAPPQKKPMQNLEDQFLFYPLRHPAGEWSPADLEFEDVFFTAADGVKLHGWYCPCKNPRAVVLHAHGNAGHLANRADLMRFYQRKLHVASFIFDYRGYGRSEGKPTLAGILADARAARNWLAKKANVKKSQIVLTGQSLGGAVAVDLASDGGARGLVLESTFSSLQDVATYHYGRMASMLSPDKLNSAANIKTYRGPLLMSHGDADEVVPYKFGRKLFEAANEPKEWLRIKSAPHNYSMTEDFAKALNQFIERLPR